MELVATVNGVPVYSDKQLLNVIGSRLEFADGSWCDVKSNRIKNKGRGEISIGDPGDDSSNEVITKGPDRYSATSLDLQRLVADVTVEPHSGPDMEVTITGRENEIKAIRVNQQGRSLVIEGSGSSGRSGVSVGRTVISGGSVIIGGVSTGSIFTGGNSIVIGGRGSNAPKVSVKVPIGTPISVSGAIGDTHIGDVRGPLTAFVSASGDVTAGAMTDVDLRVQGSGDITVEEVRGNASVNVQGSGDVDIEDGQINGLSVNVQGSGDVTVGGVAQRADLSVMGSGDVKVAHVVQTPVKNVMGSGNIRVRRIG
jgi:hypothetical protein